jgi:hypothetical protein
MKLLRESVNKLKVLKPELTSLGAIRTTGPITQLLCYMLGRFGEATHHAYCATPEFSGVTHHL